LTLSIENTERIKRQNDREISVILGNPPYNANQVNENDNNKNRQYPAIDKLIKDTYVKQSKAQKTKVYDMYSRFFRWGTSRLNNNGVLAFITNSSFINARTFDGFRKVVAEEFSVIYIIDLGGDVRVNPKLSGTKHNVFGIQTGVALTFMVKRENNTHCPCKIFYYRRPEFETAESKLKFLAETKLDNIPFEHISPDKNHNWINIASNDFESLLTLADKETKSAKSQNSEKAVFRLYSNGVVTNRDEWVYDFSKDNLQKKVTFFAKIYNNLLETQNFSFPAIIKWSRDIKKEFTRKKAIKARADDFQVSLYRPFVKINYYSEDNLSDLITSNHYDIFGKQLDKPNIQICFLGIISSYQIATLASDKLIDLCLLKQGNGGTQCLPLYSYTSDGKRIDNITNWGLKQFQTHYRDSTITKENIFYYTYAVLHNPHYRQKYELNLKREFPRLPFYQDFHQWVNWGKQLMDLHINYESVPHYLLKRLDLPIPENSKRAPKSKLKADKTKGIITLDDVTTLEGIPKEAWDYKLGNRSALEWILDQYKEKKPKDPTIAAKFNTYRFADYKEQVIDLLQRVCTVSVETMRITQAMPEQ
jgi:predicted helicase